MEFSFWEKESWLSEIDYTIVGSGIVGVTCALRLREKFPHSNILLLERGLLPNGASTKNAGFACFGSVSEILDDLKTHSQTEVLALIKQRIAGLSRLREIVGDTQLDYKELGGYELFAETDTELYHECLKKLSDINEMLYPVFGKEVYSLKENGFGFKNVHSKMIYNAFEGQIDTGKMMQALLKKTHTQNIRVLNNITVQSYAEDASGVSVVSDHFQCRTRKLLITTNGFANHLGLKDVKPARAQVLITNPIPGLKIEGTFHLDRGYYYFRNINNRILFGGGRNLDFKTEETTEMVQTKLVQEELERILREVILPETPFTIDHRWSGIMGIGDQKKPIIKKLTDHTYCGVRLGGMGVAIGSLVGEQLADLVIA